jgi:hypothetical protein
MVGIGYSDCRVITVLRVLGETAILYNICLPLSSHPCPSALYLYPISSVVFSHFPKKKHPVFMKEERDFGSYGPGLPEKNEPRIFTDFRGLAGWLA